MMRAQFLILSLLTVLAACGQPPMGTAPAGSAPSAIPTPPRAGPAALRPLAVLNAPVVGWGYNESGQATIPAGLTDVKAIDAGFSYSLALKNDGTVVGWGDQRDSQVPTGLTGVKAIAAGYAHKLALKTDGTVVAWGFSDSGEATVPAGLKDVKAIAADFLYSLALKTDGTVVAWGRNDWGRATVPAGLTGVTAIAAGMWHSLALKADGTVVAWGNNFFGQSSIPANLTGVKAIAAGAVHSLALKTDGTVVAWGSNDYGQATVPAGLRDVKAIAVGQSHNLALKTDGTVVAWGSNHSGQTNVPAGLKDVTVIAAGAIHSLALHTTDRTPPIVRATLRPATPDGTSGWYRSAVTVTWTVTDPESAISRRSGCDVTTLGADTTGTTLTCSATSAGGTGHASVTVKVDVTRPTLHPVLSSAQPVLLGTLLSVTPNASDATSGVASSSCAAPNTGAVGLKTLTCTATDHAGNTQMATVPYQVIYAFQGFFAPVANLPVVNVMQAGRAIPVKFSLGGHQGLDILAGAPTVTPYTCGAGRPTDDRTAMPTASTSGLQHDAGNGQYVYVWKTEKSRVGCYQLNVRLVDGTTHRAAFQLR